jgi:hypothetical protein
VIVCGDLLIVLGRTGRTKAIGSRERNQEQEHQFSKIYGSGSVFYIIPKYIYTLMHIYKKKTCKMSNQLQKT